MGRSIARALCHRKLSPYKSTPVKFDRFMTRTVVLDVIVEDCMKKRHSNGSVEI